MNISVGRCCHGGSTLAHKCLHMDFRSCAMVVTQPTGLSSPVALTQGYTAACHFIIVLPCRSVRMVHSSHQHDTCTDLAQADGFRMFVRELQLAAQRGVEVLVTSACSLGGGLSGATHIRIGTHGESVAAPEAQKEKKSDPQTAVWPVNSIMISCELIN